MHTYLCSYGILVVYAALHFSVNYMDFIKIHIVFYFCKQLSVNFVLHVSSECVPIPRHRQIRRFLRRDNGHILVYGKRGGVGQLITPSV
jgi:hypothetical protein